MTSQGSGVLSTTSKPLGHDRYQVHYYYDFSDWILPPNVGTNRPLKIMLDQSVYFVSKCAMYISLVRKAASKRARGSLRLCWQAVTLFSPLCQYADNTTHDAIRIAAKVDEDACN